MIQTLYVFSSKFKSNKVTFTPIDHKTKQFKDHVDKNKGYSSLFLKEIDNFAKERRDLFKIKEMGPVLQTSNSNAVTFTMVKKSNVIANLDSSNNMTPSAVATTFTMPKTDHKRWL